MTKKGLVIGLLVAVVLVAALHLFAGTLITIPASDEDSTFLAGDRILVNRWAYGYRVPFSGRFGYHRWKAQEAHAGEWIAFNKPTKGSSTCPDSSQLCVCRCLAVPGDTVWMGTRGKVSASRNYASGEIWPMVVPAKGAKVQINPWNASLYALTISQHEGLKAIIEGDSLCVDGQKVKEYQFKQDYYWLASGDDKNLHDSRTMGFIPSSCLMGRLETILYSLDGWKPRWNRTMTVIP